MKVLGISCHYHDASAALVVNGKVVASSAEERFSRHKHDPAFPAQAVDFCLAEAGLGARDVDFVAFHEDPATKLSRTLSTSFARFPFSLRTFLKTAREAINSGLMVEHDIGRRVGTPVDRVVCVPHHMSHAAHAFLTSPFASAAVMTIDAVGEWTSSAIFHAERAGGELRLKPVDVSPFPHSLGLAYSAFTSFLGFKVNDGECSTMALAAFGKPVHLEKIREIIKVHPDGSHTLAAGWFDFRSDREIPVTEKFISTFGRPRSFKTKLPFDAMGEVQHQVGSDDQRFADIACSLQTVLEEAVVAYARRALDLTGADCLAYSGGVALNCVANARLVREGLCTRVYIPPDPGDGGGAMGAALYLSALKLGAPVPAQDFHPYLGQEIRPEPAEKILPHLTPETWRHFSLMNPRRVSRDELMQRKFSDSRELTGWVAEQVCNGRIVAWCQGRAETGPRALGHRSILIRPDDLDLARRLSARVKLRAPFRPYALSLTEEAAREVLELPAEIESISRWMQRSVRVKPEWRRALRAALHVDSTTRPQCLARAENELFYLLLTQVAETLGVGAVLNTSMNEAGFPLVNSATDALMMFARTDLDVLVIGNLTLEKRWTN